MNNPIPTGFGPLDDLLGGGILPSIITDIYGAAGTGKTQLALQTAAGCIGSGGRAVFLDTTGKFRPERLAGMLGGDSKLDSLWVVRATSSFEQHGALDAISSKDADLVIVDSASDLYSFEYGREGQLQLKNTLFMEHMHALSSLAVKLCIPVIVTNMIREFDQIEKENLQPAMRQLAHARIRLSKQNEKYRGTLMLPGRTSQFEYELGPSGLCVPDKTKI